MGDRVYAEITIGGNLETVDDAEELCDALVAEGVSSGDIDDAIVTTLAVAQSALRRAVESQCHPTFYANEVTTALSKRLKLAVLALACGARPHSTKAEDLGPGTRPVFRMAVNTTVIVVAMTPAYRSTRLSRHLRRTILSPQSEQKSSRRALPLA